MNYDEFVDAYVSDLEQKMGRENVTLIRTEVPRENETLDAITVRFGDSAVAPIVYLQGKYEQYTRGVPMDEIVDRTAETVRDAMKNVPDVPNLNRENAEKNLRCALIGKEANEELLKEVPHETFAGDLAVIAKYSLSDDSSFIVRNDVCGRLQMTPAEIMETAHRNTEQMDFSCRSMSDVLRSLMAEDFPAESMEMSEPMVPEIGMYVASNCENYDGAVCITSAEFLDEVHDRFGEDFYILPSSRHEVIVLPDSVAPDVEALRSMVREVNATQVSVEDRLSDTVYHYDSLTKAVTIAGEVMEKEEVHEKIRTQARAR